MMKIFWESIESRRPEYITSILCNTHSNFLFFLLLKQYILGGRVADASALSSIYIAVHSSDAQRQFLLSSLCSALVNKPIRYITHL